jgi:hypothetical protein
MAITRKLDGMLIIIDNIIYTVSMSYLMLMIIIIKQEFLKNSGIDETLLITNHCCPAR